MNKDPWANRNKGMICETCVYFVEKKSDPTIGGNDPMNVKPIFGRCRRNAPTMKGFVPVYGNDWCGDHRLDENKI